MELSALPSETPPQSIMSFKTVAVSLQQQFILFMFAFSFSFCDQVEKPRSYCISLSNKQCCINITLQMLHAVFYMMVCLQKK